MTEQVDRPWRVRRVVGLFAAVTVLGGCGFGGDDPAPPSPSQAVPSELSSAAPTEATAAPTESQSDTPGETESEGPQADRRTSRLALAGRLRRGDFPRGWTVRTPASPVDMDANRSSCSYLEDGPEAALERGAIAQGPHMQLEDAPGYAHSQAYVFADEPAAEEWITYVDGDDWARCTRRQLQKFQDDQGADSRIRNPSREADALGQGGFVSYASFPLANEDGEVVAFTDFQFYRLGRVVIRLGLDIGALTPPQYDDYTAGIDVALPKAYNRIFALEPAEAGT